MTIAPTIEKSTKKKTKKEVYKEAKHKKSQKDRSQKDRLEDKDSFEENTLTDLVASHLKFNSFKNIYDLYD